jgi:hypothetical protein
MARLPVGFLTLPSGYLDAAGPARAGLIRPDHRAYVATQGVICA